jgi:hypothetical protein
MSSLTKGAGTTSQFLGQKIPGLGDTTVGQGAYVWRRWSTSL